MRDSYADRYLGAKMERERIENRNRRASWLDWFQRHGARSGSFRVDCSEGWPIIVQVAPLPEGTPPEAGGISPRRSLSGDAVLCPPVFSTAPSRFDGNPTQAKQP